MKKKLIIGISIFSATLLAAGVLTSQLFDNNGQGLFARATDTDTTIVLNAEKPFTKPNQTVKYNDYASFTVKNAKPEEDYFCKLEVGGYIEKKEQCYGLTSVTTVFDSGVVYLQTKVNSTYDGWTTFRAITSGTLVTIYGNYFRLYSPTGARVESVTMKFGCVASREVDYSKAQYYYSDFNNSYNTWAMGETENIMANINGSGVYELEAENTDSSLWVAKNTKALEETAYASGGKSLSLGNKSLVVFPFLLNSDAKVGIDMILAEANEVYADSINAGKFTVTLDGQYLNAPHQLLGHDDKTGTEMYYVWRDCDYGSFLLQKGLHTVVLQAYGAIPNLDKLKLKVGPYGGATQSDLEINGNGTFHIEAENLSAGHGLISYNPKWAPSNSTTNGSTVVEGGRTVLAGIKEGSEFTFRINNQADCFVDVYAEVAYVGGISTREVITFVDGPIVTQCNENIYLVGSGGFDDMTDYYNWQTCKIGSYSTLGSDLREITVAVNSPINIDKFVIQVTNYGSFFL